MRPLSRLLAAGIATAALVACGSRNASTPSEEVGFVGRAMPSAAPAKVAADAMSLRSEAPTTTQIPSPRDTSSLPSMIIRTGDASVLVDSLEVAVAQLTALAQRVGGWISNTSMQTGPDQVRSATLTIKVPSARYDEALGGLRPIGDVETVHTNAEDVGEEFVDVQARVANARRLEERLVVLLATRTGKLEDVLAVERELARVREEIERFEGRLRFLRSRVSMSTLTVTVHEDAPLVGSNPSANVIGEAFVAAWKNFVGFVAAFIASLGWLVPVAVIVGLGVVLVRRSGLRRILPRRTPPKDSDAGTA